MSPKIRKLVLAALVGLPALISTLYVKNAEALWPLSYYWFCEGISLTQVACSFTVANPGPSGYRYQWQFGDGSQTGRLASTTVTHYYAVPTGQSVNFNVNLLGYASATSPSLDNVIGCTISAGNTYGGGPGGDPGYYGTCQ